MKKYTKKFLDRRAGGREADKKFYVSEYNAEKASELLNIPQELWLELSDYFLESKLATSLKAQDFNGQTTFMAGFVIGCVEKIKKIK